MLMKIIFIGVCVRKQHVRFILIGFLRGFPPGLMICFVVYAVAGQLADLVFPALPSMHRGKGFHGVWKRLPQTVEGASTKRERGKPV